MVSPTAVIGVTKKTGQLYKSHLYDIPMSHIFDRVADGPDGIGMKVQWLRGFPLNDFRSLNPVYKQLIY